ncbi:MAG: putative transport system permease protein [Acidobacteriota bacterium]|jgi:putative ABC transport system permease protein|nr:putative transport system permease protein [Acidobacteriota bacterium]MDT7781416.1 putative transport system permease protein [Acidobacteriota bacterium]
MESLVTANVRQRPVRAVVSAAGVALGVCLVMLFTGLARGLSNDLQRRSQNLKAEIIFTRSGGTELMSTTASLPVKYAEELSKIDGVEMAVPDIRYVSQGGKGFGFEQVEGVDWQQFALMNEMRLVEGHAPEALGEVVVDEAKAKNNDLKVGSQIKLFGNQPYTVSGIYTPEAGPRVKMSLAAMQDALEAPGKCTWIYVKLKNPEQAVEMARRIDEQLPGNKIQLTRDIITNIEKSIPYLGVFLRTLVILSAVVSGLVVMLAMYTTITERTREIGILKALGASRGYIVGEIEKEAVLISVIGVAAGFAISFLAGYMIQRAYGLPFEYSWAWGLTAALIGLLGGVIGALYPAMRAANLDAVSALAYE